MLNIESFIASFSGKIISLSVHDLKAGREINIRADHAFHPASTMKVPVMMEVFRQAEIGLLDLNDKLAIQNSFTSVADGSKFSLEEVDDSDKSLYTRLGESESIRELTRLMIVRSGNLATNLLLEKVGVKRVNDYLAELGINGVTIIRGVEDKAAFRQGLNNSATARGLTHMMRLIAEGRVVTEKASREMVEIMLGQEFKESIPALLPKSARTAHKTGWIAEFYHDTGIVFPVDRQPYAITILSHGFPENDENQAHSCMAEISRLVYEEVV